MNSNQKAGENLLTVLLNRNSTTTTTTTTVFSVVTILPVHPTGTKNQHFVRDFSVRDFFLKSEHWFNIIFIVAIYCSSYALS